MGRSLLDRLGGADPVDAFSARLGRTPFGRVHDAAAEHRKVNAVRIAVGLIALYRTGFMALGADGVWPDEPERAFAAVGICVLLLLLTAGVLTPVVTAALIALYPELDTYLSTGTLGTQVLVFLLIYLLLAGAGSVFSVDAWLIRRGGILGTIAAAPYRLIGIGGADRLSVLRFLLFLAFAAISFAAVQYHLADPFWQSGEAVGVMLTNPYFSRVYEPARYLDEHASGLMHVMSVGSVRLQVLWQLLMVPLVFWRLGYLFVAVWGTLFIALSLLTLQLSYLPALEVCLWVAVFVVARPREQVAVLFDDRCNLCKRAVQLLKVLNPLAVYDFRPMSRNRELAEQHGAAPEDVEANIHGVWRGRLYVGYALYEVVTRANPLLWPLYPLMVLGRWLRVGPAIYAWVVRRRRRIFGVCEPYTPQPAASPPPNLPHGAPALAAALMAFWLGATLLFVIEVPQIRSGLAKVGVPYHRLPSEEAAEVFPRMGLIQPNVFNNGDLRTGDRWAVISRQTEDGWERVPFNGSDGERLGYHRSDVIYYGSSILWRHAVQAADVAALHQEGQFGNEALGAIMRYDKHREGIDVPVRYRVEIFGNRSSEWTLSAHERFRNTRMHSYSEMVP
jgi:predicted DCC family thiol-disulfide oxidoreductase YuxK